MDALILLAGLALFALAGFALAAPAYWHLSRLVARFEAYVEETLTELYMFDVTPRAISLVVGAFVAFCVIFTYMVFGSLLGAAIGAAVGVFFPWLIIHLMIKRRRARLETQLLDGLITLANGMRAGLNLSQSVGLVEKNADKPISQEFGLILREIEHGTSVDVALENAGRRLRSHNFRLLFAAMKTTRIRGGNMPETLDRLGESLREIVRLEEKVKAQTAEGRTSAIFMGVMPFFVMLIYSFIDSEGMGLLLSNGWGHVVLAVAMVLNVAGFLWIRKIVSFEI
jgi:tight adherence protein B